MVMHAQLKRLADIREPTDDIFYVQAVQAVLASGAVVDGRPSDAVNPAAPPPRQPPGT